MAERAEARRSFSGLLKSLGRDSRPNTPQRSLRVEGLEQRQLLSVTPVTSPPELPYAVVDTGQTAYYNNVAEIAAPAEGATFYGQDAQYDGYQPSYTLSNDGLTVNDNVTGLTWTQSPDLDRDGDVDAADKLTFAEFQDYADTLNDENYAGYSDWRAPTIKELYSLIDFSGLDPSGYNGTDTSGLTPFIDTDYFDFDYGDTSAGERIIDAQFWSNSVYESTVFGTQPATFGVNFADGRIKGYHRLHHDIEVLPNGNVLMIAWEFVGQTEALDAGRDPNLLSSGELWPDHVIEVEPTGSSGGNIVWEWHAWDHLVQDRDSSKANYGEVAAHPELIDVNHVSGRADADWTHINSIDYNAEWIDEGSPGEDNILVFNNGSQFAGRAYSSVDEIAPPLQAGGIVGQPVNQRVAFGIAGLGSDADGRPGGRVFRHVVGSQIDVRRWIGRRVEIVVDDRAGGDNGTQAGTEPLVCQITVEVGEITAEIGCIAMVAGSPRPNPARSSSRWRGDTRRTTRCDRTRKAGGHDIARRLEAGTDSSRTAGDE